MSEQIIITKELRLRITDLEYEDLSPEAHIKEIQRIYIEEMGEPIPAEIEIFTSRQSDKVDHESEYAGSAIRFYSAENGIDELYIVSEGTQGLNDWLYNIEALVAGRNYDQIEDVNNFMEDALEHFGYNKDKSNYNIPIVGLGHSQAHNTNASAYLIFDKFTSVYGVNSAQLNYYQLYRADPLFEKYLKNIYPSLKKESINIYDLNTDEIKQHAMDFYKDKEDNIVQELSVQDPLFAVRNYPGFFPLGTENEYSTNPSVPGLTGSFDKIPENYLQQLQKIAVVYTLGVEDGNVLHVINELLGIDIDILLDFKLYHYGTKNIKLRQTVRDIDENLPATMDTIYMITDNTDSILTELSKNGYITSNQKEILHDTFSNIEKELRAIEDAISDMREIRDQGIEGSFSSELIIDLASLNKIKKAVDSLIEEFEMLRDNKEFKDVLNLIGESHGITELLESLHLESDVDDRKYIGTDLYLKGTEGSQEIWVSLTATGKMCGLGKLNLTTKEVKVEKLEKTLEEKVYEVFETQRTRARVAVDYMEANPNIDRPFLHPHGFSESYNRTITRINVHEEIPRFEDTTLDMSQQITKLKTSIEKGYLLIEQYRDSIEKLFSEEADIAEQIDFIEGVYYDG